MSIRGNCCYRGCKNDWRYSHEPYMEGIFFIPFPKPKSNFDKCQRWISACARPEFLNIQRINSNRYVCSFHFLGGAGPTENNPDPIAYHEVCVDDTHETCRLNISTSEERSLNYIEPEGKLETSIYDSMNIEESRLNGDDSSMIVDEPNSTVDEPSLVVDDIRMSVGETILITESMILNTEGTKLPILNINSLSSNITDTTDLLKKYIENQFFSDIKELTWTISRNDDSSLNMYKVNCPHICAIEVKININLEFEILVYGKTLAKNHSLLHSSPKTISKLSDLLDLLVNINSIALCAGTGLNSEETKYSGKLAHVNIYTKTFFSKNCHGFIMNGTRKSCKNCNDFKSSQLLKQKRAKKNDLQKNPRNFRNMTREDLIATLSTKTRHNRILKRKNLQLKETISTLKQSLAEEPNFVFTKSIDEDIFSSKENFLHLLYQEHFKLLKTKRKRPESWHPDIIKWCLHLRAKSPSAYETLCEVLPLPEHLWKYGSKFSCQSGFTVECIKEMRAKIDLDGSDEH